MSKNYKEIHTGSNKINNDMTVSYGGAGVVIGFFSQTKCEISSQETGERPMAERPAQSFPVATAEGSAPH
jgi:hypothetical protein